MVGFLFYWGDDATLVMVGYIRLSPLAVEHTVVVMTTSSQSRRSRIESYGWPIFDSHFIKVVLRISGSKQF